MNVIFDLLNDVILLIRFIIVNFNKNYCVFVKIGTEKYELRKILITFSENDTKFSRNTRCILPYYAYIAGYTRNINKYLVN